jgi:hypothetical protein
MRILFTSTAGLGHFYPLLPLIRATAAAGGGQVRRSRSGTTVAPHLREVGVTSREAEVLELVAQG